MKKALSLLLACVLLVSAAALPMPAKDEISSVAGDDGYFKVLMIGNSLTEDGSDFGYSEDSTLYRELKALTGAKVKIGKLSSGGKAMSWHAAMAKNETEEYFWSWISDDTNGKWVDAPDYVNSKYALESDDWDVVTLQPYGKELKTDDLPSHSILTESLPYMSDYVSTYAPQAKKYLYLPWSTEKDYQKSRDDYGKMAYYISRGFTDLYGKVPFVSVLPVGAGVEAARSTFLEKIRYNDNPILEGSEITMDTDPQIGIYRDKLHMSLENGRYIANVIIAETLVPESARVSSYQRVPMRESKVIGKMPYRYELAVGRCIDEALFNVLLPSGDIKTHVPEIQNLTTPPEESVITEADVLNANMENHASFEFFIGRLENIFCRRYEKEGASVKVSDVSFSSADNSYSYTVSVRYGYSEKTKTYSGIYEKRDFGDYFIDVNEKDWFFDPVVWAAEYQITSGVSAFVFSPDSLCTRGQTVTFLWRAAGEPEIDAEEKNPFTDVKESDYYYEAVLWAVGKGITKGMTESTFEPKGVCTRGQTVTFLYRAAGAEEPENRDAGEKFTDVRAGAYYASAVAWAVGKDITKGMTDTTFEPETKCTRAQIVTFLCRTFK